MPEKWIHRADLAEAAIEDRHATGLWALPRTNLAEVAWPGGVKEKLMLHWHYWWQAHYLDCQIDAALRTSTRPRRKRIQHTVRGIRVRNIYKLSRNKYYDDKAWLALALRRMDTVHSLSAPAYAAELEENLRANVDPGLGVLPWREGENFFNVPTNGPAAIMLARTGYVDEARTMTDWIFDNLMNEKGLIMDGVRMRMHGPEIVKPIHPYCQGVVMGACMAIIEQLRNQAGLEPHARIETLEDADRAEDIMDYVARVRQLVHAVAKELANDRGAITTVNRGGDGGLFKGILARYLAEVAVNLPNDGGRNTSTKKIAARLVLASAEAAWGYRLEIDGLPVFPAEWTEDAQLPRNAGVVSAKVGGALTSSGIPERDLSVQLSGWMLMEAAARVSTQVGAELDLSI
ncbi:glycoside hydrolase family 76 protein [Corynebacterium sp. TAE3-ERU30]|uniref:glycoside hydrolase family 76 protein n=1 Tax=Corynebacterium sp. TAE3-ERU30 TaxID=2849496 RepID=UPI001C4952AE|nr:glycoside hydrolase family 76 [Corynebacterium sp. TAE3-ERU30]